MDTVVKHGVHVVQNDLGLCTLYELSAFPIEILSEKLAELGYLDMLADKVDLTVAAYTLVHLIDPIGSFLQIYDLMRPSQGIILVQNFFALGGHDDSHVQNLIATTKLEFFTRYGTSTYAFRRESEQPGQFSYTYQEEDFSGTFSRARLLTTEQIDTSKNPKNTLKGFAQDTGSPFLRASLPPIK